MKAITLPQIIAAIGQLLLSQAVAIIFDPAPQRVDVTGDHAFVPPSHDDYRGPCPCLNSLANQ
jgi:Peroxidase, family 2